MVFNFWDKIMFKIFISICLIFTIELIGCRTYQSESELIEINIERNVSNIKSSTICDFHAEINYIALNCNSNKLRTIIFTYFSSEFVVVSDRFNCILFDSHGNFISKIGNRGKGPGEYLLISNISIGKQGHVFLQNNKFIYVYDIKGNYLEKFIPEIVNNGRIMYSWIPISDSMFIGQVANNSGDEKVKAVYFNQQGKTIKSVRNHIFFKNSERNSASTNNSDASIYKLESKIFVKEKMNDTLFVLDEQYGFEPVYYLNLGKFGTPIDVRELPMNLRIKEEGRYIVINSVYETSQYVFIDCDFRNHNPAERSDPVVYKDAFGNSTTWGYYPAGMLGIYDKFSKEIVFAEPAKTDDELGNNGLKYDSDGGVDFYP